MSKISLKTATLAIALLVLAGCNSPSVGKSENGVGRTVGQGQKTGEAANRNNGGQIPPQGSNDNGNSGTDIGECLKSCDVFTASTGVFSKATCSDGCWASEAEKTGDESICETKVDQSDGLIVFACYLNVAEKKGDVKYCDRIGDNASDIMRAGCYSSVAKKAKDPSLCDGVKGNVLYQSCVDDAAKSE